MSVMCVKVKKVVFHLKPHFEEYAALIIAKSFGMDRWDGINEAAIYCRDGSKKLRYSTEVHLQKWGNLFIGIGNGPFDEHRPGIKGKCSADLVAERISVDKIPKVRLLLQCARRGDVDKNNTACDFGTSVQTLTDGNLQPNAILKWLETFFSLYFDEKTILNGQCAADQSHIVFPVFDQDLRNLPRLYGRWLAEKGLTASHALTQFMTRHISALAKQMPSRLMNLAEGVALINAYSHSDDSAYRWVSMFFDTALKQQTEFINALAIIKKARVYQFLNNSHVDSYQMIMVGKWLNPQDNTQLVKATRFASKQTNLLLTQRPSGQVGIFTIQRNSHNPLPMILRVVRLEEEIVSGITDPEKLSLDYSLAGQERKIKGPSDCWYYFVNDKCIPVGIFNGSFTQSGIQPTRIPFDTIRRIALTIGGHEDNPRTWSEWINRRLDILEYNKPVTHLLKE